MPNSKKGKSSKEYYDASPASKAKKLAYQREYNKRPDQVKKRSELIKKNRESDKKGIDRTGKDFDHSQNRYVKSSINRGRNASNGGNAGDVRARKGKKK